MKSYDIDRAIQAGLATGKASRWDDVGVLVIDTASTLGAIVVGVLARHKANGDRWVAIVQSKREIEGCLKRLLAPAWVFRKIAEQRGALVVFVGIDEQFAVTGREWPQDREERRARVLNRGLPPPKLTQSCLRILQDRECRRRQL